jgi:hypothetical protein
MTLGKSSSAGSESPVPFDAVLLADEECCTKDKQALMLLICASNMDISDSQQSKTDKYSNASETQFQQTSSKSKSTMLIPFSQW